MDCPNCGEPLSERERSGVKIDFCASRKGVWLDRGELDKIIAFELGDGDGRGIEARNAETYREARSRDPERTSFFEGLTEMLGREQ